MANAQYKAKSLFETKSADSADAALMGISITTFPSTQQEPLADPAVPEKIRQAFVFIQEDAASRRNAPGILSGARACLDVALKELGQPTGGRRARIQALADEKLITQGIAEWAQMLWEEGSDAVHDLDASIDRAIEHVDFLKLFFEVAFSLPSRIAAASHGAVQVPDPTPPE